MRLLCGLRELVAVATGWFRETVGGSVLVDDLVLPGEAIPARDEVMHERVGTIAGAARDSRHAAMAELIDVVLDRPVFARLADKVWSQLRGDDLVSPSRRPFGEDRAVEIDDHA